MALEWHPSLNGIVVPAARPAHRTRLPDVLTSAARDERPPHPPDEASPRSPPRWPPTDRQRLRANDTMLRRHDGVMEEPWARRTSLTGSRLHWVRRGQSYALCGSKVIDGEDEGWLGQRADCGSCARKYVKLGSKIHP